MTECTERHPPNAAHSHDREGQEGMTQETQP